MRAVIIAAMVAAGAAQTQTQWSSGGQMPGASLVQQVGALPQVGAAQPSGAALSQAAQPPFLNQLGSSVPSTPFGGLSQLGSAFIAQQGSSTQVYNPSSGSSLQQQYRTVWVPRSQVAQTLAQNPGSFVGTDGSDPNAPDNEQWAASLGLGTSPTSSWTASVSGSSPSQWSAAVGNGQWATSLGVTNNGLSFNSGSFGTGTSTGTTYPAGGASSSFSLPTFGQSPVAPPTYSAAQAPTQTFGTQPTVFSPQSSSFAPQSSSFAPQSSSFAPQSSGFASQSSSFAPQSSSFAPQSSGFAPQSSGFAPLSSSFASSSFALPSGYPQVSSTSSSFSQYQTGSPSSGYPQVSSSYY